MLGFVTIKSKIFPDDPLISFLTHMLLQSSLFNFKVLLNSDVVTEAIFKVSISINL